MGSTVLIRRPREDERSKTGLGRYSDNVEDALKAAGVDYEVIECRLDLKSGVLNAMLNGFIRPFLSVLRRCGRNTTVHAADELCGVFFPFTRGRKIVTVHHVIREGEDSGPRYYRLWMRMAGIATRHADSIIAISEDTARDVRSVFSPDAEVVVIPNGISSMFQPSGEDRERLVAVVAEMIPRKNLTVAIEAFAGMPADTRMVMCGRGQCREGLEALAKELGVNDRIEFVDFVTEAELLSLYNRASVVFCPSLHEGTGMPILEATRCGTPVLCLNGVDIPAKVLECTIQCDGPGGMAVEATRLVSGWDAFRAESERCRSISELYGRGFSQAILDTYSLERTNE